MKLQNPMIQNTDKVQEYLQVGLSSLIVRIPLPPSQDLDLVAPWYSTWSDLHREFARPSAL